MEKRKPKGYPEHLKTIGEHIRKKRMNQGLLQEDVAALFATSLDTITNWENNRCTPQINHSSKIIAFLGFNPFTTKIVTLGEQIRAYRQEHGLSHKKMAKLVGVNPSTILHWENDEHKPMARKLQLVNELSKRSVNKMVRYHATFDKATVYCRPTRCKALLLTNLNNNFYSLLQFKNFIFRFIKRF